MVAMPVLPRRRDQIREPVEELKWGEFDDAVGARPHGFALVLGLEPRDIVLLATALLVSVVTLGTGRTSMMQGAVHLVLFATYLFLACVP